MPPFPQQGNRRDSAGIGQLDARVRYMPALPGPAKMAYFDRTVLMACVNDMGLLSCYPGFQTPVPEYRFVATARWPGNAFTPR